MPARKLLVLGAERHGVVRLIFTSAYGVGDTWSDVPPLSRIFARLALRHIYADKAVGEASLLGDRVCTIIGTGCRMGRAMAPSLRS